MLRVRTTRVCPHAREGDFALGTLLHEQLVLRVEQKERECTVGLAFHMFGPQVAVQFAARANNVVVVVDHSERG